MGKDSVRKFGENGNYRILELNQKAKTATLSSATLEEITAGDYPAWTYERRGKHNIKDVDKRLRDRAEERGYKVL